jgi:hypothetical protein
LDYARKEYANRPVGEYWIALARKVIADASVPTLKAFLKEDARRKAKYRRKRAKAKKHLTGLSRRFKPVGV